MATPEPIRDPILERALPSSPDTERAILGAIILDNTLIAQAVELLKPGDFYVPSHRRIFEYNRKLIVNKSYGSKRLATSSQSCVLQMRYPTTRNGNGEATRKRILCCSS
ncbi:MAG TPA: DnaB-like helicase N-terminal domain-containing protein [Pyrinomonadaceae bacterium]|nr:DnaB-like helicase N-terminal domain-containing protein [Pyrinomonadaceae bacterium]